MANKTIALEASDTSISTATISIKVVQVGKKQMTQSTFKQLPECNLVDEENVVLTGVVWGHVRYHWGYQNESSRHFLVQSGENLCRSLVLGRYSKSFNVWENQPSGFRKLWKDCWPYLRAIHALKILDLWNKSGGICELTWDQGRKLEFKIACAGEYTNEFEYGNGIHLLFADASRGWPAERLATEREHAIEVLAGIVTKAFGACVSMDVAKRRLQTQVDLLQGYCRRWDELMGRLSTVEQLFIAT